MLFKSKKNSSEKNVDLPSEVKSTKKIAPKVALIILGIVIGIGCTFLYIQKFGIPFKNVLQNVSKVEESKVLQETTEKVGKLIVLPKDETPVMATIMDAETLIKSEPFYTGARNGDVVLMYQKALKAIIYSPERNIIVNVGPVYVPPADQKNQGAMVETKNEPISTTTAPKKK